MRAHTTGSAPRTRTAGPKRRTYHHGNLHQALVDAALELLRTRGADALTLRAAARKAGVSQAAPYRHFRDKRALLAAVAEDGFRELTKAMQAAQAAEGQDRMRRLRALGLAYVRFALAQPAHFRVMFGREVADKSDLPQLAEAANETFGLLAGGIEAAQSTGSAKGDPKATAIAAWALVHGLAALLIDGQFTRMGEHSPEELAMMATSALFSRTQPSG